MTAVPWYKLAAPEKQGASMSCASTPCSRARRVLFKHCSPGTLRGMQLNQWAEAFQKGLPNRLAFSKPVGVLLQHLSKFDVISSALKASGSRTSAR